MSPLKSDSQTDASRRSGRRILTEGDLNTAGGETLVQPPGKKIQSLNLMSGKWLWPVLIIRVKTMVIFGRVVGAGRSQCQTFWDYLNRFDKDSQFIVVTPP